MLKIVRVVTELDFGGVERRIEITAEEFVKRKDVELIIIVLANGGRIEEKIRAIGIQVHCLHLKPKIPNFSLIFKLYVLLRQIAPDVVHTSGSEANFHGLIAAWLKRIRIRVGEEIGFPRHGLLWRYVFKNVYRLSLSVIGISKSVAENIIALKEVKQQKTVIIYNPVTLRIQNETIDNAIVHIENFTFITVCRLVDVKNLQRLIEAFKQLINNGTNASLWIVGDGPLKNKLELLVKELQLQEYVIFLGYQEQVSYLLKKADVFIIPSLSEGFSIALVEAMLNEMPSIATNVGGPGEILTSDTGILVNPLNIEDIRAAMQTLYDLDNKKLGLMGKNARNDAIRRFSPERYVDELLHLYKSLDSGI